MSIPTTADATQPTVHNVMRAQGLTWRVGGFTIIDDIDLDVHEGEFLSIIGPNGAGKSTLVNLLSGALHPTSGSVWLDGKDVSSMRAARRVQRGLGRTFQTSSLFEGLSVLDNARIAARSAIGGSMNLLRAPRSGDEADERARSSLERVGLAARSGDHVSDLAYGDKRKLEIGLVLCGQPSVLLLDEPTAGVSTEEVVPLVDVIRSVHEAGMTVVMVEHRMDFVIDVSTRIAVLQDGKVLICSDPDVVMADKRVLDAYLGPEF